MHQKYSELGPKVALGTDVTKNLVYEISIPLQDIYGINYLQIIKKNPLLSIGFTVNAFPKGVYTNKSNPSGDGAGGFSGAGANSGMNGMGRNMGKGGWL